MHLVLYLAIFSWTVYVVYRHGIGPAFGLCLLPAVVLVHFAKGVPMPLLPNLSSLSMVFYGTIAGCVLRPQPLNVRWNLIDTAMCLILIPIFFTTWMNGGQPVVIGGPPDPPSLKLAQRYVTETAVTFLFPYFMARVALQQIDGRKWTLRAACAVAIFVGFLSAVESSGVRPNITARTLGLLQWNTTTNARPASMVFKRFGLARAIATAGQQIDLGNVGVLVGTIILILVPATGAKWTSPLVVGGILGSGAMVVGSVSMTSWAAMVIAVVGYALFTRPQIGKYFVLPVLLACFGFMVYQSYTMISAEYVGDNRPGDAVGDSKYIRYKIMQDAWPIAQDAGFFGYGSGANVSKIGVGSVDNSYLLFVIQTGWLSLVLWVFLFFTIALKGAGALGRVNTPSEQWPLAAMLAGFLGIVFAMYTVFFGFCYAVLFAAVIGMISSMCQMLAGQRQAAVSLHGGMMPHGFPVAMSGPMR